MQQHVRDLDQRVDVWSETGVELAADGFADGPQRGSEAWVDAPRGRARPMADTPNGSAAWPFPMMVRVGMLLSIWLSSSLSLEMQFLSSLALDQSVGLSAGGVSLACPSSPGNCSN